MTNKIYVTVNKNMGKTEVAKLDALLKGMKGGGIVLRKRIAAARHLIEAGVSPAQVRAVQNDADPRLKLVEMGARGLATKAAVRNFSTEDNVGDIAHEMEVLQGTTPGKRADPSNTPPATSTRSGASEAQKQAAQRRQAPKKPEPSVLQRKADAAKKQRELERRKAEADKKIREAQEAMDRKEAESQAAAAKAAADTKAAAAKAAADKKAASNLAAMQSDKQLQDKAKKKAALKRARKQGRDAMIAIRQQQEVEEFKREMGPERVEEILQKQDERDRVAEFKREMGPERTEKILQDQDERDRVAEFKREMGPERTEKILQDQDTRDAALVKGTLPSGHQVAQRPSATLFERMRANVTAPQLTSLTDVARGIGSAFVGAAEALNPARELIDRVNTQENVAGAAEALNPASELIDRVNTQENVAEQQMSTASATASQLQAPTQALSQVAAEQQSMSQEQLEQTAERLAQDPQIQRLVAAGVLDWKDIIQNKEDPELVSPEKLRTAVARLNALEQQAQGRYGQAYATYQRDRVRAHNRPITGTSFTMWQPPQYAKA